MTDDQWYDLFESVAANLRHGNLTRKQQHEELARIVAAERERCAVQQGRFAGWFREIPSAMSYRLWQQGGHEQGPDDVALYEA